MLLVLDESVQVAFPLSGGISDRLINALDIVGDHVYYGRHALYAPRAVLSHLLRVNRWSRRCTQVLKAARDQFSDRSRLFGLVETSARIMGGPMPAPFKSLTGRRTVIDVPLSWIDRPERLGRSIVLAENLDDVFVYADMAKAFAPLGFERGYNLSFEAGHGGGATIGNVFDNKVAENRLMLCFVDADLDFPGAGLGGTARLIAGRFADGGPALAHWAHTECRDLENALPDAFYEACFPGDALRRGAVNCLAALTAGGHEDMRNLLDICDGLSLQDLFKLDDRHPKRHYWLAQVGDLMRLQGRDMTLLPCLATGTCSGSGTDMGCTCIVFPSFGKAVLTAFHGYLGKLPFRAIHRQLTVHQAAKWTVWGKLVFDWCCANAPAPV